MKNLFIIILSLLAYQAQAANIVNSSFENPALVGHDYSYLSGLNNGWSFVGSSGIAYANSIFLEGFPPDGNQVAFLQHGSSISLATISQDISGLIIGNSYSISFYLARLRNSGGDSINVQFGTTDFGLFTPPIINNNFKQFTSATAVATASTMTLLFTGSANTALSNTAIDQVTISSAISEPSTIVVFGLGIALINLVKRK